MWILVMLMMTAQGPRFEAYPQPMASQEMCENVLTQSQASLNEMLEKAKIEARPILRCLQWGDEILGPPVKVVPQEKAE